MMAQKIFTCPTLSFYLSFWLNGHRESEGGLPNNDKKNKQIITEIVIPVI